MGTTTTSTITKPKSTTTTWSTTVSLSTIKPKTTSRSTTISSNKMTPKSTTITSTVKPKTSIVNIVNLKTVLLPPIETTLFPESEEEQKKPVILWTLVS